MSNRQWLLQSYVTGHIDPATNFKLNVTDIPKAPQEGHVVLRGLEYSLDPTQRGWISGRRTYRDPVALGSPMEGFVIGVVIETNSPEFSVGDLATGVLGWEEYIVANAKTLRKLPPVTPSSIFLGLAGLTGLTAYFGLNNIGKAKAGETVVVSGAAGATGSIVVQLALQLGCKVVGVAGTDDKVEWLKALGATGVNYKGKSYDELAKAIKEAAPNGIDVYFENVGGDLFEIVIDQLNVYGRVVCCGSISSYNDIEAKPGPRQLILNLVRKRATIQGFTVSDFATEFPTAVATLVKLFKEGKLENRETVIDGFENLPTALTYLFEGKNTGKLLVRATKSGNNQ